jgi:hypothetical protein
LEQLESLPEQQGKVDGFIADNGCISEDNVESLLEYHILPSINSQREKQNQKLKERFAEPEPLPEKADCVTEMKCRFQAKEGRKL